MNNIFTQVEHYMREALQQELPEVTTTDLEKDGAVFYMNGKNGTAFDWYVNDHLPCFFIFYNDKENLGAVKATLYTDGNLSVYVYGERGHAKPEQLEVTLEVKEQELYRLAALLTKKADLNKVWDADIHDLDSDGEPDAETVQIFADMEEAHVPMRERAKMLGKTAILSKKIREEGWKIGYGIRMEATNERDSGWAFSVGNETDEYINDPDNLEIWVINSVLMYEPALTEFITEPEGTGVVRVAPGKMEIDAPGKKIIAEKKESEKNTSKEDKKNFFSKLFKK